MKAKSWKSFLQDPDTEAEPLNDDAPDGGADLFDPALLSSVAESNPELESLLAQRDALEQEMARLTGNAPAVDSGPRALGEIPAMRERKRSDAEWAEKRQDLIDNYLRKREEKAADEPPLRGLDSLRDGVPLSGLEKRLKAEEDRFSQVREDLTSLDEKALSTSEDEFPPLRDLDKKTGKKKPSDSYDPMGKTWEELDEARRKVTSVKDAFTEKLNEAMDLDQGVDFDEKQAEMKEKALEKLQQKKEAQKAEEQEEAKREEKRKQEKEEGPEAEDKQREKKREKQKEKRDASRKAEKRRQKREARKKERMKKKQEEERAEAQTSEDEERKREAQKEKRRAEKRAERKKARQEERREEKKREQKRERKRNRFDI